MLKKNMTQDKKNLFKKLLRNGGSGSKTMHILTICSEVSHAGNNLDKYSKASGEKKTKSMELQPMRSSATQLLLYH